MDKTQKYKIITVQLQHLPLLLPLFDAYRVFYKMPSNLQGAQSYLTARIKNQESVIFLATNERYGLGFVQLYPTFESLHMQALWVLHDIYVLPAVRRLGVATNLMLRAQDHARATGAVGLALATAISNQPAQALYESLGWRREQDFYYYDFMF
jgi:ribosomal protein S18 acetylase RimI-like enzyme